MRTVRDKNKAPLFSSNDVGQLMSTNDDWYIHFANVLQFFLTIPAEAVNYARWLCKILAWKKHVSKKKKGYWLTGLIFLRSKKSQNFSTEIFHLQMYVCMVRLLINYSLIVRASLAHCYVGVFVQGNVMNCVHSPKSTFCKTLVHSI